MVVTSWPLRANACATTDEPLKTSRTRLYAGNPGINPRICSVRFAFEPRY